MIFIGVDVLEVMDTGIFLDVHMKGGVSEGPCAPLVTSVPYG